MGSFASPLTRKYSLRKKILLLVVDFLTLMTSGPFLRKSSIWRARHSLDSVCESFGPIDPQADGGCVTGSVTCPST